MAFSDLILQLGNQAKQLEATASAHRSDNDAQLKARETELRSSLAKAKSAVDQKLEAGSELTASRVAGLQRTLSEGFEALRTDATARGELDAEDAIAFAVHALQEAEYLLAAGAPHTGADADAKGTKGGAAVAVAEPTSSAGTKVPAKSPKKPTK